MNILRSTIFSLLVGVVSISRADVIVDFNELPLGPSSSIGSYYDGYGEFAPTGSWSSKGAIFQTTAYGPGWSYSNVNNTSEVFLGIPPNPKYFAQFSAFTGTGFGGSGNYAMATGGFGGDLFFNLPADNKINSLRISNSTYAAISMRDGDPFAKKFGGISGNDPDFFKITFTGFSNADGLGAVTGSTDFFLADYRSPTNALDYIVNDWRLLDLSTFGNAKSVGLSFSGSDNGTFGLNTPAYVAIDNITLTAVPEPSSFVLLIVLSVIGNARFRRKYVAQK